jgi:hypothetical protein
MCEGTNSSVIVGGIGNNIGISTTYNTIVGGLNNSMSSYACYNFIGGGSANNIALTGSGYGCYNFIGGGGTNVIDSVNNSAILGGLNNVIQHADTMIVGNNICSDRDCTTFVNNLSIMNIPTSSAGLPIGAVWSNSGVLNIV